MKDYRDPIYGFIALDDTEQSIVDTVYFQRLRNIKQLGTTFLVYPSANHTRFEHSMGVLQASTNLFDGLVSRPDNFSIIKDKLNWDDKDIKYNRRILRLASLLHDIGHAPLSHAAESLFHKGKDHEDYASRIIIETEIADKIKTSLGEAAAVKVAGIATEYTENPQDNFLSKIITGELGTDRIDYLIRDSHHLGVRYGYFDYHRLLNSLHLRHQEGEECELAVDNGGTHTVEGFILARYYMFLEVYYHKTRRILDMHLVDFLSELLNRNGNDGHYPVDIDDFIKWDDLRVLQEINLRKNDNARRLSERKHFRRAFDTSDHPDKDELVGYDWLCSELKRKFPEEKLRFDEATKAPYSFKRPSVFVLWRDNYFPLNTHSTLIKNLREISKKRVYADESIREDVKKFSQDFWDEKMEGR